MGVDLKPGGLRLYQAATLTISPAGEGETAQAAAFSTRGGGKEFYLYPLELESGLSMKLLHFSDYGAYVGSETDPIIITDEPAGFMPFDWESQLAQMMAELTRQEREAQLRGEEGDPEFDKKLEAILSTFYIQVISPLLGRIISDCEFAKANIAQVLSWNQQVALLGLDGTFNAQMRAVTTAVVAGMDNCWQKVTQPCVDQSNAEQIAEVIKVARANQLLGGDPEKYNPFDPDIQCQGGCAGVADVKAWQGTVQYTHSRDAANENTHVVYQLDVNVDARLEEKYRSGSNIGFFGDKPGGNVSLSSEDHSHGDDHLVHVTFQGSGPPVAWDAATGTGSNMSLSLDLERCRYGFYLGGAVAGSGTYFGEAYEGQEGFNPIKGDFDGVGLNMSGSTQFPVYSPGDIEGSTDKPVWFAERYDVAGILGDDLGTVTVTWSFIPAQ